MSDTIVWCTVRSYDQATGVACLDAPSGVVRLHTAAVYGKSGHPSPGETLRVLIRDGRAVAADHVNHYPAERP